MEKGLAAMAGDQNIGMACEWIPKTKQYANNVTGSTFSISWVSPGPMAWMPIYGDAQPCEP